MTDTVFDHPTIGGRLSIVVLMYGDYFPMHRECLTRILDTTPVANRSIRVFGNQICHETSVMLARLMGSGVDCSDISTVNRKKYPVMRQALRARALSPLDRWLVWFDDDSIVEDDTWFTKLAEKIVETTNTRYKMIGDLAEVTFADSQVRWMHSRPWYHGLPFMTRNEKPIMWFCPGGFWAMETATALALDIPDIDLAHNGGDYMIGAQIWQGGYDIMPFNAERKYVRTSAYPRRGLNESHTAMRGWIPSKNAAL